MTSRRGVGWTGTAAQQHRNEFVLVLGLGVHGGTAAARATSQLTLPSPSPSLPPPLPSRRPCSWSSNTRIFYSDYTPTPAHPQNSGDYFARARTCIGAWMGSSQFTRTACVLYAKVSAREGFSHKLYRDSERSPSTVVQTREEEDNIFFFKRRF